MRSPYYRKFLARLHSMVIEHKKNDCSDCGEKLALDPATLCGDCAEKRIIEAKKKASEEGSTNLVKMDGIVYPKKPTTRKQPQGKRKRKKRKKAKELSWWHSNK